MMRPARLTLVLGTIGALSIAALMSAQQEKPAAPMQIEKTLIGIYGVLSSVVSWRARDRTPYGAWRRTGDTEADVRAVLTRTDRYWIAFGLAGAGALTRLMSSLLFGTGPLDPATYAA